MEPKEALPLLGFRRRLPKAKCPACRAVLQVCRTRASKRWIPLLKQAKSSIGYKAQSRAGGWS